MPVVAPPRQPDRPLPGRRSRRERSIGPVRAAARRCQPVRASQPAMVSISASTAAGVARAPIPAYRNVAMSDLPRLRSRRSLSFNGLVPGGFSLPPRCRISPAAQNGSGQALPVRAFLCENCGPGTGREFITRVRRLARRNGIAVRFDRTRGKGSHGTLYYGERFTVVKDRGKPLKTGTFRGMCKQLGSTRTTFREFRSWQCDTATLIDLHKERTGGFR